jgi:hypothetical protein
MEARIDPASPALRMVRCLHGDGPTLLLAGPMECGLRPLASQIVLAARRHEPLLLARSGLIRPFGPLELILRCGRGPDDQPECHSADGCTFEWTLPVRDWRDVADLIVVLDESAHPGHQYLTRRSAWGPEVMLARGEYPDATLADMAEEAEAHPPFGRPWPH